MLVKNATGRVYLDMSDRNLRQWLVEGLDYSGDSRPATDPGQDFFDLLPLSSSSLAVSVGAVSGSSVGASVLRAGICAFLHGAMAAGARDLAKVVGQLNRMICSVSPEDFYATLLYTQVDPFRRQLRYVSAGQEPALLIRHGARHVQRLDHTGTVLGLTERASYRQRTIPLEPGDRLVILTDGITEAFDAHGIEIPRILELYPAASANDQVAYLLDAAANLAHEAGSVSDRTVVVVRFTEDLQRAGCPEEAAELALSAA